MNSVISNASHLKDPIIFLESWTTIKPGFLAYRFIQSVSFFFLTCSSPFGAEKQLSL